jgi:hypothetical protein
MPAILYIPHCPAVLTVDRLPPEHGRNYILRWAMRSTEQVSKCEFRRSRRQGVKPIMNQRLLTALGLSAPESSASHPILRAISSRK